MKSSIILLVTLIGMLFGTVGQTGAVTIIDFDTGTEVGSDLYLEDGFRIKAIDSGLAMNHFDIGDINFGIPAFPGIENEIYLHGGADPSPNPEGKNGNAEEILIDRFGQDFDLLSLDVEALLGDSQTHTNWIVLSSKNGLKSLTDEGEGPVTFAGSDWIEITSVTIRSDVIPLMHDFLEVGLAIDNITLQAVPEPTTIALLIIGLVGLAGTEVRRRHKYDKIRKLI